MHVLVVEVPGSASLRIAVEAALAAAGHVPAGHPASADVLLVCGSPGPELTAVIDRVWDQVPFPRHRAEVVAAADIPVTLRHAQLALADRAAQRSAAERELSCAADAEHGHDETESGHEDMSMSGPGGYPLAEGAEDRDGLEMDVLHRRLGPILPSWPAGLVIGVTLAGDTITEASAWFVADAECRIGTGPDPAVIALDDAARVLSVTGWDAAAARTLRLRDLTLAGDRAQARRALPALQRRIARSIALRWSLRGLPVRRGVDVRAVLLMRLERATVALGGQRAEPEPLTAAGDIAPLITGRDLGSARLIIAALTVGGGSGDRVAERSDIRGDADAAPTAAREEHLHG